jgi:hypothetical protein
MPDEIGTSSFSPAAIGRNINQIAHAANRVRLLPHSVSGQLRAMLNLLTTARQFQRY